MAISLRKGQKISLTKGNPSLKKIMVGLGWMANDSCSGYDFDLDASVLMCDENGRCADISDFVYFGNLKHPSGSVIHRGDNLVGSHEYEQKDDEQIMVDLSIIPQHIQKLVFIVNIYQAEKRGQNFGQVSNAFIRLVDQNTNKELIRYDLTEDFYDETAVVVGEIYRYKNEWKFNAMGSGLKGGINELLSRYGIVMGTPNQGSSFRESAEIQQSRNSAELAVLNSISSLKNTDDVQLLLLMKNLSDVKFTEFAMHIIEAIKILGNA